MYIHIITDNEIQWLHLSKYNDCILPCIRLALLRSNIIISPLRVPAMTNPSKHIRGPLGNPSQTASSVITISVCMQRNSCEPLMWNTHIKLVVSSHSKLIISC